VLERAEKIKFTMKIVKRMRQTQAMSSTTFLDMWFTPTHTFRFTGAGLANSLPDAEKIIVEFKTKANGVTNEEQKFAVNFIRHIVTDLLCKHFKSCEFFAVFVFYFFFSVFYASL